MTQLIVFAAFCHPDVSVQLKPHTCGAAALGGPTALTIAREVKFGFYSGTSFSVFVGAAVLGSCVCRVTLIKNREVTLLCPPKLDPFKSHA